MLTFPALMLLQLQKSLKSLQNHVHEFLGQLAAEVARPQLSGGALTPARAKLRASAFVELNQSAVLATVYGDAHAALVQRWHGHRLLSVDSSLLRLPSHAAVSEKFGWVQCANRRREKGGRWFGRAPRLLRVRAGEIRLDSQDPESSRRFRPLL